LALLATVTVGAVDEDNESLADITEFGSGELIGVKARDDSTEEAPGECILNRLSKKHWTCDQFEEEMVAIDS
jgi:hypothetical protein